MVWSVTIHLSFLGKKSDHPLSPAFVPSLFSHVLAEERQKRQRELEAFESRQDTKRRKLEEERRSAAASALLDLSATQSTAMDSDSDSTFSADSLCLKEEQQHDSIDQAPGTLQAQNKKLQQELGALQVECQHLRQENPEAESGRHIMGSEWIWRKWH